MSTSIQQSRSLHISIKHQSFLPYTPVDVDEMPFIVLSKYFPNTVAIMACKKEGGKERRMKGGRDGLKEGGTMRGELEKEEGRGDGEEK